MPIPKYVHLINTGTHVHGAINKDTRLIGKVDTPIKYAVTLKPSVINALAGKTVTFLDKRPNNRFRLLSISGKADTAVAAAAGGFSLEIGYDGTAKGAFNFTAGIAAGANIPVTTVPDELASAANANLTIKLVGTGSITSVAPITVFIEVSQEPTQ